MNPSNRRNFLKTAGLVGAAMLVEGRIPLLRAQPTPPPAKIHGVNLGGWLVLEKWIKPSLFAGTDAQDEYTLCLALGKAKAAALLQKHRETWITADDFKWLASHGINAVRLPVGYWVAEDNPPFITGVETMERAFSMAKENGISVLLDLHGVPGSQNGWDHSGRQGALGWHTSKDNIAHSLRIIEDLSARCKPFDNLLGIELVNEPRQDVPLEILKSYYEEGYLRVRKHLDESRAAVVFHDSFRPFNWEDFMLQPDYENVILDTHLYQCFSDQDHQRDMKSQIAVAAVDRDEQLVKMQKHHVCIVGEWSLGLPPKSMQGQDPLAKEAGMRAFAGAQLVSFESTRGWFFWTYRTEADSGWNFRQCINRGWLPEQYGV